MRFWRWRLPEHFYRRRPLRRRRPRRVCGRPRRRNLCPPTSRPPTRIRVYPRYNPDDVYPRYFPGRNAVRECTAHLVQELRPSGTVITPRMDCFWRPG
jgi:hypothetical protein